MYVEKETDVETETQIQRQFQNSDRARCRDTDRLRPAIERQLQKEEETDQSTTFIVLKYIIKMYNLRYQ